MEDDEHGANIIDLLCKIWRQLALPCYSTFVDQKSGKHFQAVSIVLLSWLGPERALEVTFNRPFSCVF